MIELLWSCDGPLDGEQNMRRDRELWQAFEADPVPGVRLRVYGWQPGALSLGFHQSDAMIDRAALRDHGLELVRRPTGGAAVLHRDEITYAVAGPLGLPGLGRGVVEIHAAIADALSVALRESGIDPAFGGDGTPQEFACFGAAGGHELTVNGRKLVGSALRRGRNAFLQHGSVLTGPGHLDLHEFRRDLDRVARAAQRERLLQTTCTLVECGCPLGAEEFGERLARALACLVGATAQRVRTGEGP